MSKLLQVKERHLNISDVEDLMSSGRENHCYGEILHIHRNFVGVQQVGKRGTASGTIATKHAIVLCRHVEADFTGTEVLLYLYCKLCLLLLKINCG